MFTQPDDDNREAPEVAYRKRAVAATKVALAAYKNNEDQPDRVNLAYLRGMGWDVTSYGGAASMSPTVLAQRSSQDEIHPAIDQMKSAMAMTTPHVAAVDKRYMRTLSPDELHETRIVAATLNWHADKDKYDVAVEAAVLNALTFNRGGILKVDAHAKSGIIKWRVLEPWEVHFSPRAKRIEDVTWAVEVTTIELDEFEARVADGTYFESTKPVNGDTVSISLSEQGQDQMARQDVEVLRNQPWKEVTIYEFRDFVAQRLLHIVAQTQEVVMDEPLPVGNPYSVLIFDAAVGGLSGVSIVSRMVTLQRDLNELTNVRLEVARRAFAKLFIDKSLFKDDDEYNEYLKTKPWEPIRISRDAADLPLKDKFWVQEAAHLSADFHTDVKARTEHARWIAGATAFREAENIRTAEEAARIAGATEARMQSRMQKVMAFVMSAFETTLRWQKWLLRNGHLVGYDPSQVLEESQDPSLAVDEWQAAIELSSAWMRLEPFAPLMENETTRRQSLERIIQTLAAMPQFAQLIDWKAVLDEVIRVFKFNPAWVIPPQEQAAPAMPGQEGVPAEGAQPEGSPVAPPPPGAPTPAPAGQALADPTKLAQMLGGTAPPG